MKVRPFVKKAFPVVARATGLSSVVALRYRGRGAIFALHSVVDPSTFHPDETLRCSEDKLEATLRWLKRRGVDFVSLDEAMRRLSRPSAAPFAVFTFDDGYADNLTRALPVMERFAAPFTVYVTTGMITRAIDAWWFGLAALIRRRDKIVLPGFGHLDCSGLPGKKRSFASIEAAIHRDFSLLARVRALIDASNIDCRALVDQEALNEHQLRRLAQHPLVTIGAHTMTHRNLAEASTETVRLEMAENRRFLQDITGTPIEHFAYPFGHARACGEREAAIARAVGFRTAVTTRHGQLFSEHLHHAHELPRVHLAYDDTPSSLHCKMNGVLRAVHSRFGSPIALM
ncbi:MAG TPA: polysaccharide deacetylase family protein [Xanthobacteraceae bacterium]